MYQKTFSLVCVWIYGTYDRNHALYHLKKCFHWHSIMNMTIPCEVNMFSIYTRSCQLLNKISTSYYVIMKVHLQIHMTFKKKKKVQILPEWYDWFWSQHSRLSFLLHLWTRWKDTEGVTGFSFGSHIVAFPSTCVPLLSLTILIDN